MGFKVVSWFAKGVWSQENLPESLVWLRVLPVPCSFFLRARAALSGQCWVARAVTLPSLGGLD